MSPNQYLYITVQDVLDRAQKRELGSYEPCSSTPSIACRLFAMYHAMVAEVDKKQILESMAHSDGNCCVLLCTTAFGMGIDIPNIRTINHFGPPADVDDNIQESGRVGRDGIGSNAILYYYLGCLIGKD